MRRSRLSVLILLLTAGCNPTGRGGTLTAHWTVPGDTTTATVKMPATARWCVGPSRLDIRAAVGDTGLGLAIYSSDSSATSGAYTVLPPGGEFQVRPRAAVALRWVGKVLVQGWWGDSGSVTLADGPLRGLSGNSEVWLTSSLGRDSVLALEFEFKGVRVRNDTLCDAPVLPVAIPLHSSGTLTDSGVD